MTINNNINVNQYEVPLCQIKSFLLNIQTFTTILFFDPCLTPKYSIYFCWVRFLVLLLYSTIEPTTETTFCWILIFSFHCQSDASFFFVKIIYQFIKTYSQADHYEKTKLIPEVIKHVYNQHKHKKKTQLFTTTSY